MSAHRCRFKKYFPGHSKPYCRVTYGECQFINDEYDCICPIYWAYKDWEPEPPGDMKAIILEDGTHFILDDNVGNYIELIIEQ